MSLVHLDNAELMSLLESSDVHTVTQVKELITDHLNTGREAWLVNTVVDAFVESHSSRCLEILGGVSEPHDKHLFDRLFEHWKGGNKVQTLMVIGQLARREPLWLYKIVSHSLFGSIIKTLKVETDVVTLLTGALTIAALLPVVRTMVAPSLSDIFDLFHRLVVHIFNGNTGVTGARMTDIHMLHLQVAGSILFQRLYAMYPCHFLTYLRNTYSRMETANMFKSVVKPMLSQVRVHPLLVTANKEKELMRERWKDKGVYDILVECAQLSLDLTENGPNQFDDQTSLQTVHGRSDVEHHKATLVKKLSTDFIVSDVSWTPSLVCGLSTPPAGLTASPLVAMTTSTTTISTTVGQMSTPPVRGSHSKPTPLVLQSVPVSSTPASTSLQQPVGPATLQQSGPSTLQQSGGYGSSALQQSGGSSVFQQSGTWEESSVPSTPLLEPVTPRLQATTFEYVHITDESALDLSGRFVDRRFVDSGLATKCTIGTQTSTDESSDRAVPHPIMHPTERSTSTEDAAVSLDSDSSSSPLQLPTATPNTPASVAAFVKKVKRIRFDSISVSKEQSTAAVKTLLQSRSISCPDLASDNSSLANIADVDCPSTASRHVLVIGSPVTPTAVKLTGDMQVSPIVIERTSVGTQTSLYVYGSEPADSSLTDSLLVPYELLTSVTLPFAPFIQCYSCLHSHTTATNVKPLLLTPLYTTYSPSDLLDRHIVNCVNLHAAHLKSTDQQQTSVVDLLSSEVKLLHTQLMFERHRRDINARRSRRLMSRVNHLASLSEHNEAMRDQLQLQEAELNKMKAMLKAEQTAAQSLKNSFEKQRTEDETKMRNLTLANEDLSIKVTKLETIVKELKSSKESVDRELEVSQRELFLKDKDVELLKQKAGDATQLKEQVTQLNTELLLMGELHEKYQQRLTETTNTHNTEIINLRLGLQAATAQCTELKSLLTKKSVESNALSSQLIDVEQQLNFKEMLIDEQKQLLEQTKKEYSRKLDSCELRHQSSSKLLITQQQTIQELHYQLAMLGTHNTGPDQSATATAAAGGITGGREHGKDEVSSVNGSKAGGGMAAESESIVETVMTVSQDSIGHDESVAVMGQEATTLLDQ